MVHVGLIFTIDLISLKFSVESTDTRIGNQSFNNHFLKYDVSKIPTSKGTSGFTLFPNIVHKSSEHRFFLLENNVNHNESKYLWLHELILLCEQYFLSTVKKTGKMLNLVNLIGNVGIYICL